MQIIIHRTPTEYLIHHFTPNQLDEIKKICYDLGIKYYCIVLDKKDEVINE